MPSLGPDMDSGKLVAWRIKPGDTVKRGDVVALVETDKGVIDVEIFASGRVEKLFVEPGTRVPVDTVLAQLTGEESLTVPAKTAQAVQIPATRVEVARAPIETTHPTAQRQKISPAARARARQLGIDVTKVPGSGAGGVTTLEDVAKYTYMEIGRASCRERV